MRCKQKTDVLTNYGYVCFALASLDNVISKVFSHDIYQCSGKSNQDVCCLQSKVDTRTPAVGLVTPLV